MSTPDRTSRLVLLAQDASAALTGDAKVRRYRLARVRIAQQRTDFERHAHLRRSYD